MVIHYSGSVHYANGDPISGVVVRIFDKDAAGRGDDDLTISAGLSDADGRFSITYEPLRSLDFHDIHLPGGDNHTDDAHAHNPDLRMPELDDIYLPYLKLNFTINGVDQEHRASLGVFKADFHLPVNPPVQFLPSRDGFNFPNSFSGYFFPYSTPAFLSSGKVSSKYGLCGGMCAAAYDFILAGKGIPQVVEVPHQGTRFQRYLFQRQMDSFGGLGQQVVKVAQWTSLPDGTSVGIMRRTADEFSLLRSKLDQGNPVILALIYEYAGSLKELSRRIFRNHQVLAWAYHQEASGEIIIQIYDPNLPGRDDVIIRAEQVVLGKDPPPAGPETALAENTLGLKSMEMVGGEFYKDVRGFFEMPYKPVKPPEGL
jgi:hypothetical protein